MLPQLLNYFEKTCYLKDINHEWFSQEWSPLDKILPGVEVPRSTSQASYLKNYMRPGDAIISGVKSNLSNNVLPEYL